MTSGTRRLESWVDGFLEYTEGTSAPKIFRKWAAVSIIAGALERKVWTRTKKRPIYPNLYILLTASPGQGKSDALTNVADFLSDLDGYLAPTSVSRASLIDALVLAKRTLVRPGDPNPVVEFNSMTVCSEEFGNFLTVYEGEFLSALNYLYDCRLYTEQKRSLKNSIQIDNPQLNLIGGTTPGWLSANLPQHAWLEGFTSRLIFIYAENTPLTSLWQDNETDSQLKEVLKADLLDIHNMYGMLRFEDNVKRALDSWYLGGQEPIPSHPKLDHYLVRRPAHLLKLCAVMSTQRASDYIIRMSDLDRAFELLFEAETAVPLLFQEMKGDNDEGVYGEIWLAVKREFEKTQAPVPEHWIIRQISKHVKNYSVKTVLEVMVSANMLVIKAIVGLGGRPTYAPVPRDRHNNSKFS